MKQIRIIPATVIVASLLFATSACKQRTFSNNKSGGVVNPDAPQVCTEKLDKDAPYSAGEFKKKLVEAFHKAVKSGNLREENLRDFLFADEVEAALKGQLEISIDDCALTRTINESLTKPSYFYWLSGNGRTTEGGMTLYKGTVYAEGFYRCRAAGVTSAIFPRRAYNLKELMTQQPWLEWNKETRSFNARVGSPVARIVQAIQEDQGNNSITLHRGTNTVYSAKEKALATANSFRFGDFGGIFTTPSYEAAKGWANPVVLSAKIDPGDFIKAATTANPDKGDVPSIYVGIEYSYPEIAFLYEAGDSSNLFFNSIRAKCVTEKAQGADKNFAQPCK
ncbi:MAG: hypothetical protein RLZZ488_389 [Pseudomonadota bacterium]|jgi:hypothetical protein